MSQPDKLQTRFEKGALRDMDAKLTPGNELGLCAQCKANADSHDADGYHRLAEECRQFCRDGHKFKVAAELGPAKEQRSEP